ncbi:MAG: Sec-independent protein translocase TatB [Corynebacterium sp.]|nr:Sec-independent protein translocase TatB [Corynebacterium sp.]
MFSSIGWFEIFLIALLGLVIIGPERLPGVIEDIRAAIFAARKAINNAKAELNGEFGELGKEFDSIRQPLSQAAEWGRMGPRGLITKALFDGDDSALQGLNFASNLTQPDPAQPNPAEPQSAQSRPQQIQVETSDSGLRAPNLPQPSGEPNTGKNYGGGGFSWADIT